MQRPIRVLWATVLLGQDAEGLRKRCLRNAGSSINLGIVRAWTKTRTKDAKENHNAGSATELIRKGKVLIY